MKTYTFKQLRYTLGMYSSMYGVANLLKKRYGIRHVDSLSPSAWNKMLAGVQETHDFAAVYHMRNRLQRLLATKN